MFANGKWELDEKLWKAAEYKEDQGIAASG
jgi:hypothetical protein